MPTVTLSDGTAVAINGSLDARLPVVILLHGLNGNGLHMTAPAAVFGGIAFDQTATFPVSKDEGFHIFVPPSPAARFYLDPAAGTLTSWDTALQAAGFSTVTYTQIEPGGLIAPNVAQLTRLAKELLMAPQAGLDLTNLRVAIVAHSRGGIIARSFLVAAASDPTMAPLLARVKTLITLHSPHGGSGVATLAGAVDGLLAGIQGTFGAAGIASPAILGMLRGFTGNPAFAELAPGSVVLTALATSEPVAGVIYHTFGGNSTRFARIWSDVYTPDSTIPWPVPFPLFHWRSMPTVIGIPLDIASFVPIAAVVPIPFVQDLMVRLAALSIVTPELAPGAGDLLVADARAHLPFSATRATNPLNHAEALWNASVQAQVVGILKGLRDAGPYAPVYAEGDPGKGVGGYNLADPADRVFAFDYDSTGKQDHLALYRPGTGTFWILKNTGGMFSPVYAQGDPGNGIGNYDLRSPADRAFAFDYDSSGKLDHIALYRPGTGTFWILRNNGGAFSPVYAQGDPGNGIGNYDLRSPNDQAFAFDYDSRGKQDHIALFRPGRGTFWILRNNGGTFAAVYAQGDPGNGIGNYDVRSAADQAFAFDYDSSGKLDHLALYRAGTGTFWILKNVAGVFSPVYAVGDPGNGIGGYDLADPRDRALAIDYDGSGKLDHLALYRPGSGTIWILKRTGPGAFAPVFSEGPPGQGIGHYDLASPNDRIVAFDFDSNGKLDDLLLYRPGTGTLWILKKQ